MRARRSQRSAQVACLAGLLLAAIGCGLSTRFAQTASEPDASNDRDAMADRDGGAGRDAAAGRGGSDVPDAGPLAGRGGSVDVPSGGRGGVSSGEAGSIAAGGCEGDLASRITVTTIGVDVDIRYRTPSYDNFPIDERVGFGVAGDGRAYIGWLDSLSNVRVTPLDASLNRRDADLQVPGLDIGGLVAHDDGFALLTRRMDPGEPLTDPNNGTVNVGAAFLVRYRDRAESFAVPLTGTASITREAYPEARDCAPRYVYGRLAWNGVKHGVYFQVHGCVGDPHESYYSDKLVYANDRGEFVEGGWDWNCGNNLGLRLLAEPGAFTAMCLADSRPWPGLNLVTEGVPQRQLSPEFTVAGYVSAAFGSIVKVPADGSYVVLWLSRGLTTQQGRAAATKTAYDVSFLRLSPEYEPIGRKRWLTDTNDVAETNLHLAPYGRDRLLMIWDRITQPRCNDRTCFGPYSGTFARLLDLDGTPLSEDVAIPAPPNTSDDIVVFPNGDVGWAFVPDPERSYQNQLFEDRGGVIRLPSRRQLAVARMRVCD